MTVGMWAGMQYKPRGTNPAHKTQLPPRVSCEAPAEWNRPSRKPARCSHQIDTPWTEPSGRESCCLGKTDRVEITTPSPSLTRQSDGIGYNSYAATVSQMTRCRRGTKRVGWMRFNSGAPKRMARRTTAAVRSSVRSRGCYTVKHKPSRYD